MAARETKWKSGIVAEMRRCRAEVLPLVASQYMPSGWPDIYVVSIWFIGWLEFKYDDTKIEPHQIATINRLNAVRKNTAFVVRYPDLIETANGELLDRFKGDGLDLLLRLYYLTRADERSHLQYLEDIKRERGY